MVPFATNLDYLDGHIPARTSSGMPRSHRVDGYREARWLEHHGRLRSRAPARDGFRSHPYAVHLVQLFLDALRLLSTEKALKPAVNLGGIEWLVSEFLEQLNPEAKRCIRQAGCFGHLLAPDSDFRKDRCRAAGTFLDCRRRSER